LSAALNTATSGSPAWAGAARRKLEATSAAVAVTAKPERVRVDFFM
jgi:hypothetical protein